MNPIKLHQIFADSGFPIYVVDNYTNRFVEYEGKNIKPRTLLTFQIHSESTSAEDLSDFRAFCEGLKIRHIALDVHMNNSCHTNDGKLRYFGAAIGFAF